MEVVPAVDLLGGRVVHARRGERHAYRPLRSCLTPGDAPVDVVQALHEAYGFARIYLADLDAIQGGPAQDVLILGLVERHPGLSFLVDAGLADAASLGGRPWAAAVTHVLGTESQRDVASYLGLVAACPGPPLLSLDRRGATPLDPAGLWGRPDLWPEDVLLIDLARVGADAGPDRGAIEALPPARATRRSWLGGGVRDLGDLRELAALGAHAVLVSSALHEGRLAPAEVRALATGRGRK